MTARRRPVTSRNTKDGRPYRVVELFSGIGAQHMALERAGIPYDIVGVCDIDYYALKSYEAIHNGLPPVLGETKIRGHVVGDVTKVIHLPEDVDICIYSSPCQDVSAANTGGKGFDGEKSGLIKEVGRILVQAQKDGNLPRYLLLENVANALSNTKKARNLDFWYAWVDFLSSLGYTSRWGTLNAKDFPETGQNRNRAFLLSHLGPDCPDLPTPPGGTYVLGDVLEGDADIDPKYYVTETRLRGMDASSQREADKGNGFSTNIRHRDQVATAVTCAEGHRKTSNFILREDIDPSRDVTRCKQVGELDIKGKDCIKRVYGTSGLSPTITRKTGGNRVVKVYHEGDVRRLTPRESFRLQGFGWKRPDGSWDDTAFERAASTRPYSGKRADETMSDTQLYSQAGNSICVPVLEGIFEAVDRFDIEEAAGGHKARRIQPKVKPDAKKKSRSKAAAKAENDPKQTRLMSRKGRRSASVPKSPAKARKPVRSVSASAKAKKPLKTKSKSRWA